MTERPILFSGPMVRAILEGRKTQTRRVVKNPKNSPVDINDAEFAVSYDTYTSFKRTDTKTKKLSNKVAIDNLRCPHGTVGDRLWVRESCCSDGWSVHYAADNGYRDFGDTRYDDVIKLHHHAGGITKTVPSIHMPRWASRLTLEITGARVERLQEISEEDAIAEGCGIYSEGEWLNQVECGITRQKRFEQLWQSINGPESWAANPWVWVIEFRRIQQ